MDNTESLPFATFCHDGLLLSVYIQPRASKNQICGILADELKIRLTSPPVDGAANKLCREFVAELFKTSKSSVTILSGETSRHKRLKINCTNQEQLKLHLTSLLETLNIGHIH